MVDADPPDRKPPAHGHHDRAGHKIAMHPRRCARHQLTAALQSV